MRRALITIFSVVGLSLLGVAETSAQIDLGKALGTLLSEAQKVQQTGCKLERVFRNNAFFQDERRF